MNLMFTISCGNRYEALAKMTLPRFVNYAKRIKCDFECVTKSTDWANSVSLKSKTKDYLKKYERVFFIDIDCYIHPESPDIFEMCPNKSAFYIKKLARDGHFQINSGVFLAGQEHRKVFDPCVVRDSIIHVDQSNFEKQLCEQLNRASFEVIDFEPKWHVHHYELDQKEFFIYHVNATKYKKELLFKKIISNEIKIK